MLVLESNKEYSCAFEVVRTWNTILINYKCKYVKLFRLTMDVMVSKGTNENYSKIFIQNTG